MKLAPDSLIKLLLILLFSLIAYSAYCEARFYKSIEVKKLYVKYTSAGMLYFINSDISIPTKEPSPEAKEVFYLILFKQQIQNFPRITVCRAKTRFCFEYTEPLDSRILNMTFNKDKSSVNFYAWFVHQFKPDFHMY